MRIASWNVNSLKVRLPQVEQWLQTAQPDILGLQELKLSDEMYPDQALQALGYHSAWSGQKTYNGVALISRQLPSEVVKDIPGFDDPQRRVVAATYGDLRVINLYVVNGQSVGSDKYAYKLAWLAALRDWLSEEIRRYPKLVVIGDFNVAPADLDVHDPKAWANDVLCSPAERAALQALLALGLHDSFRHQRPDLQSFSWWDYRLQGFRRNRGLRIDLVLISDALLPRLSDTGIDREPRGWERPSDHTPVWAELA